MVVSTMEDLMRKTVGAYEDLENTPRPPPEALEFPDIDLDPTVMTSSASGSGMKRQYEEGNAQASRRRRR